MANKYKNILVFVKCFLLWVAIASSASTDGCGDTKMCFFAPASCSIDQSSCMFVSLAWNKDSETIDVNLSGGSGAGNEYIAVAFGFVPRMEDADMYYCDGVNVTSGALQIRHTPPVIDNTLPNEITNPSTSTNSGVGQCSFTRAKSVSKTVSNNQVKEFDLEDKEFYILLARGNIAGGRLTYHTARAISGKIELEDSDEDDDDDHEDDHHEEEEEESTGGTLTNKENCNEGDAECIFFTWSYDSATNSYNMELSGKVVERVTVADYISIALAFEPKMEDADLYVCTGNDFETGTIRNRHRSPTMDSADENTGVVLRNKSLVNQIAKCSFTRPANVERVVRKVGTTDIKKKYDLTASMFYVLFSSGVSFRGNIFYHGSNRWVSEKAENFQPDIKVQLPSEGCGTTKNCLYNMENCQLGDDKCILLSWKHDVEKDTFDFDISGLVSGTKYVAFAFASSGLMANADTYACMNGDNWHEFGTGVIKWRHIIPFLDNELPDAITSHKSYYRDGILSCSFTRAANIRRTVTDGTKDFNLTAEPYFVLTAVGEHINFMHLQQHASDERWASMSSIDFTVQPEPVGCGNADKCVSNVMGCNPADAGCIQLSWTFDSAMKSINFTFTSGMLNSGDQYVAIAFATSGLMENADLYYCTGAEFKSGVIGARYVQPVTDASIPAGITNTDAKNENGVFSCSFTREVSITKSIDGSSVTFDMSNPFHVLYAIGPFVGGDILPHASDMSWSSPSAIYFTSLNEACGDAKVCATSNGDCNPADDGCIFMSWQYDRESETVDFTIAGGSSNEDEYLAIAFAPAPLMENADLYYCTNSMLKSGVIGNRHSTPVTDAMLPAGITNVVVTSQDGAIVCSFTRAVSMDKMINGILTTFDFSSSTFHLLYATGPVVGGNIQQHTHESRGASLTAFDFLALPPPPIDDGCDSTRNCIAYNDCNPYDDGCGFVSWAYDAVTQTIDVKFSAGGLYDDEYVSFAFAPGPAMENADLYYCAGGMFKSGVIGDLHTMPVTDPMLPMGITNSKVDTDDGAVVCSFTRAVSIDKMINGVLTTFNLSASPFSILYAVGSYAGNMLNQHTVSGRWATVPITFVSAVSLSAALPPLNEGCSLTKTCFSSNNCDPSAAGCLFVSWSYDSISQTVDIQFSMGSMSATEYISIAFGSRPLMQNADLYYCAGGIVKSGVIGNLHTMPVTDSMLPPGVTDTSVRQQDGATVCSFTRTISIDKVINGVSKTFDLSASAFYILYATGSYAGNVLHQHTIIGRGVSSQFGPIQTTTTTAEPVTLPSITGCGTTKFCHTSIKGCNAASDGGCVSIAIEYDAASSSYNIEFEGAGTGIGDTYVGIAFASQGIMANAELYFCTGTSLKSGTILGHVPPIQDETLPSGVTNHVAESANGVQRCSFTRAVGIMRDISTGATEFNFLANEYYTLFSVGSMSGNNLAYHGEDKWVSGFAFNFTTV
uniref:Putative ferric-chelate reductase 1 n=1 Tax=Phallusia mammillata TaxID=59560 RepID=A0A6F9DCF6_9ASCI|nr:putative ferric-chelate reductase 1 [Phallusia mammillata]